MVSIINVVVASVVVVVVGSRGCVTVAVAVAVVRLASGSLGVAIVDIGHDYRER